MQLSERTDAINLCFGDSFPNKCYGFPDYSLDNFSTDLTNSSKTVLKKLPELTENHNGARPIYFKEILNT